MPKKKKPVLDEEKFIDDGDEAVRGIIAKMNAMTAQFKDATADFLADKTMECELEELEKIPHALLYLSDDVRAEFKTSAGNLASQVETVAEKYRKRLHLIEDVRMSVDIIFEMQMQFKPPTDDDTGSSSGQAAAT